MATAFLTKDFTKASGPARVAAVEAGLPVKMLRVVMRDYGFRIADLARIIAPRRTLERRLEAGERLSIEESDRLARLIRLLELTKDVFDDNASAIVWLSAAHDTFNGRTPLDLLRTEEGGRMVEDRLLRLKHGFFA